MELKPQDLLVALKVMTLGGNPWNQRNLAEWLEMSLSEVNGALKRAQASGLMIGAVSRGESPQSVPSAVFEFCSHGVRYCFPGERGMNVRGVPTGLRVVDPNQKDSKLGEGETLVWPAPNGKIRGTSLSPLYKSVPTLVAKKENEEVYHLLALIDVFRVGQAREKKFASERFANKLGSYLKNV